MLVWSNPPTDAITLHVRSLCKRRTVVVKALSNFDLRFENKTDFLRACTTYPSIIENWPIEISKWHLCTHSSIKDQQKLAYYCAALSVK